MIRDGGWLKFPPYQSIVVRIANSTNGYIQENTYITNAYPSQAGQLFLQGVYYYQWERESWGTTYIEYTTYGIFVSEYPNSFDIDGENIEYIRTAGGTETTTQTAYPREAATTITVDGVTYYFHAVKGTSGSVVKREGVTVTLSSSEPTLAFLGDEPIGNSNEAFIRYMVNHAIQSVPPIYVGVNSKAREVTDMYVGVNGKARKVTAIYVGVNGKAREVFKST